MAVASPRLEELSSDEPRALGRALKRELTVAEPRLGEMGDAEAPPSPPGRPAAVDKAKDKALAGSGEQPAAPAFPEPEEGAEPPPPPPPEEDAKAAREREQAEAKAEKQRLKDEATEEKARKKAEAAEEKARKKSEAAEAKERKKSEAAEAKRLKKEPSPREAVPPRDLQPEPEPPAEAVLPVVRPPDSDPLPGAGADGCVGKWMEKKSPAKMKGWQKRWFVFDPYLGELRYSAAQNDPQPTRLPLAECIRFESDNLEGGCFELHFSSRPKPTQLRLMEKQRSALYHIEKCALAHAIVVWFSS